mmetsp:Transcript_23254/g.48275  ORF Transcript_23254/g.48275 Transcript_23254/m.48275 type:complete len:1071 (+) Transcript_23254:227-3439(+)
MFRSIRAVLPIVVVNGSWLAAYHLLNPRLSSLAACLPAVIYCNHVGGSYLTRANPLRSTKLYATIVTAALSSPLFLLWVAYAPSQLLTRLAGVGTILVVSIAHIALAMSGSSTPITGQMSKILPVLERSLSEATQGPEGRSSPSIEVSQKLSFTLVSGFTGYLCLISSSFFLVLSVFVGYNLDSPDAEFSWGVYLYVFPTLFSFFTVLQSYVFWKSNVRAKQRELQADAIPHAWLSKIAPPLHNAWLVWLKFGSLAHNGKYSIMTVIMIDLIDFIVQAVGLEALSTTHAWSELVPYAVLIALNGFVTGFAITFVQDHIKVEGVAAIDVFFDVGYIYFSVNVFKGQSGFLTSYFPLCAAILKTHDAYAKKIRRFCALEYTTESIAHDVRKARKEETLDDFLLQYLRIALKTGEKERKSLAKARESSAVPRSGLDYDEDDVDSIRAPKSVVMTHFLDKKSNEADLTSPTSDPSNQSSPVQLVSKLVKNGLESMRGNSARSVVAKEDDNSDDDENASEKLNTSLRLVSSLGIGKALSTLTGVAEKGKQEKRRRGSLNGSVRERSLVGSVAELFGGRAGSHKKLPASRRGSQMMKNCLAKFYNQSSFQSADSLVGISTFYINRPAKTIVSFAVEQGFGIELEVLETFSARHRAIWTTNANRTVDTVLDQVVKIVDSRTIFVGVVSRYHRKKPMRNLSSGTVRAKVHLECYYTESLNKNHAPVDRSKTNLSSATQGWPDRVDFGKNLRGGCKVTYFTCRKGHTKHVELRKHMEDVLYSMNSYFVHLALARRELALEGELTLGKAMKFAHCSREQVEADLILAKKRRQVWEQEGGGNSLGGKSSIQPAEEEVSGRESGEPPKLAFDVADIGHSSRFAVLVEEVDEDDDYLDIPFFESEILPTTRRFRRSAGKMKRKASSKRGSGLSLMGAARFSFRGSPATTPKMTSRPQRGTSPSPEASEDFTPGIDSDDNSGLEGVSRQGSIESDTLSPPISRNVSVTSNIVTMSDTEITPQVSMNSNASATMRFRARLKASHFQSMEYLDRDTTKYKEFSGFFGLLFFLVSTALLVTIFTTQT